MVSFCIKNNNQNTINYLLKNIELINLDNIHFCEKKFSKYNNIILHYTGKSVSIFYNELANVLCKSIIELYEPQILKKMLYLNYFYFEPEDIDIISKSCKNLLNTASDKHNLQFTKTNYPSVNYNDRKISLWASVLKYITSHKSMVLDGFITFRTFDYLSYLDNAIDNAVNQFVIDKEYFDFINLLKLYIDAKPSLTDLVHLIYINGESILLDKNQNIISITKNAINLNYLSDISFSSNDYALNSLLSLLPKKIIIHLVSEEDEFINTLKLIFGSSVTTCTDCTLCHTYKILNNVK